MRVGATPVHVMARQDADAAVSWHKVGPWLAMTGGAVLITLNGWSLRQGAQHSAELAAIRSELAVRVQKADQEHSQFVQRREVDGLSVAVERLSGEIKTLNQRLDRLVERRR